MIEDIMWYLNQITIRENGFKKILLIEWRKTKVVVKKPVNKSS